MTTTSDMQNALQNGFRVCNERNETLTEQGLGREINCSTPQRAQGGGEFSIHPFAEVFPMLDDEALDSLADSIRENGLREPIALDSSDRVVDGRNRLEACRRAGVEPTFLIHPGLNGDASVASFIADRNAERRHLTSGQQAMGRALMLQAQGKRRNGRWERGSLDNTEFRISNTEQDSMRKAGLVLDVAARATALGEEFHDYTLLPAQVMDRTTTLSFAHKMAEQFDVKAAYAEGMRTQPLTEALMRLELLLDEAEQLIPLPVLEVPITKQHRNQLDTIGKRARALAETARTYAKENR